MLKNGDKVKIVSLGLKDTFPVYGKLFKLHEGDLCEVLLEDVSDDKYPFFLKKDGVEFWLSNESALEVVNEKEVNDLRQEIIDTISQLNKLLDNLDNYNL